MDETTRELMWNIPAFFKVTMYFLLILSSGFLFNGLYQKFIFVTGGKSFKEIKTNLIPKNLNWSNFLQTIFFTGKVPRVKKVALFHSLIYYGFIILWIATDVVAIHYDTPFKIFKGPLYIIISFAADFGGLAVLFGLIPAYYRRYVKKEDKLSATNPNQEKFMYAMLVSLVIVGFLIEGLRILGTGLPEGEQTWSPIGWLLANLFEKFNLSDGQLSSSYRFLWFFHMANTMVFIASLGYTKFFHIIALPLNSLLTPARRGAILNTMNFQNENAETFGLGKLSELTMKNRMDLISCVECGRCTDVCPAHGAGKNLNPKTIITKVRDLAFLSHGKGEADAEIWGDKAIYQFNEIDACTTCGACMEECPANIEHVNIIMEAKRYKTLTLGAIPAAAGDAVTKIR